jgi:hypothetical protein
MSHPYQLLFRTPSLKQAYLSVLLSAIPLERSRSPWSSVSNLGLGPCQLLARSPLCSPWATPSA